MTREEVLEKLKTLGVNISADTLRRWVNAGLVPTPERGNNGRAGGRWSQYPLETPWEAFAAWHLLKDNSLRQVAEIRNNALSFINEVCTCDLEELIREFEKWQNDNPRYEEGDCGEITSPIVFPSIEEFGENDKLVYADSLIFEWLMLRIKTEYGIAAQLPAKVHVGYFGEYEKNQWGKQLLGEFSSELGKDEYNVVWQIKRVQEGAINEIHIIDENTGATVILKPRNIAKKNYNKK